MEVGGWSLNFEEREGINMLYVRVICYTLLDVDFESSLSKSLITTLGSSDRGCSEIDGERRGRRGAESWDKWYTQYIPLYIALAIYTLYISIVFIA